MKRLFALLGVVALLGLTGNAWAQPFNNNTSTANQNVTLTVTKVAALKVSLNQTTLEINSANDAGTALNAATATGSYSRLNNFDNAKLTAQLSGGALSPGFTLSLAVDGNTPVNISDGASKNLYTSLPRGAQQNGALSLQFAATPEAGTLTSTRQIVFTLTE